MSYSLGWTLYWACLAIPVAAVALGTLDAGGLSSFLNYLETTPAAALLTSAGTLALWGVGRIVRHILAGE